MTENPTIVWAVVFTAHSERNRAGRPRVCLFSSKATAIESVEITCGHIGPVQWRNLAFYSETSEGFITNLSILAKPDHL